MARSTQRILTEASCTNRLPDDLKRTVIRRGRTIFVVISADYVTLHSHRLTNRERYAARNVAQPTMKPRSFEALIFLISKA